MAQPPVRDYVPFAWTTLVIVKAEHFRALAHFHAATALCGGPRESPAPPSAACGGGRLAVRAGGLSAGAHGPLCPQRPRSSWCGSGRSSWSPRPPLSPSAPHWHRRRSPRSAGSWVRRLWESAGPCGGRMIPGGHPPYPSQVTPGHAWYPKADGWRSQPASWMPPTAHWWVIPGQEGAHVGGFSGPSVHPGSSPVPSGRGRGAGAQGSVQCALSPRLCRQGPPEARHPGAGGGAEAARRGPRPAPRGPAAGGAGPGAAPLAGQVLGAGPGGRLLRGPRGPRHPA